MQRIIYLFVIFLVSLTTINTASFAQTNTSVQTIKSQPNESSGATRWISDDLFTYLRAGPGKGFRLLGSVNAGTKIQLLNVNKEAGYAQIIDDRQRTGWIEIRYVSRDQSIRDDVDDLNALIVDKDESVQSMQNKMQAVMQNLAKSDDQKASLNRKITQQLEEISNLHAQIKKRARDNSLLWFTRGSILGVSALLIGYVLGIFGRRRKHSNRLM